MVGGRKLGILLTTTGVSYVSDENISERLKRLQKNIDSLKKDRKEAEEELTEIGDVLKRLRTGQTKHKHELDQEQKRQDEKKRKTP